MPKMVVQQRTMASQSGAQTLPQSALYITEQNAQYCRDVGLVGISCN